VEAAPTPAARLDGVRAFVGALRAGLDASA
jgi:hypothetical protein